MRTKRSRDSRLVDKFQRTKEEMQAESQQNRPAVQNAAITQVYHGEEEEEDEEELQVSLETSSVLFELSFSSVNVVDNKYSSITFNFVTKL